MQYNPVGVFQWKDNNKTNKYGSRDYIFLTNVKNNAGERIIVPVYIEATYDYYNVSLGKIKRELDNEVKTVYGKGKIYSYLNNYIKKGDLKTIEINKRAISNGAVQSRTGTNSSLITHSIPSLNTDVNSQYMQNGQNNTHDN